MLSFIISRKENVLGNLEITMKFCKKLYNQPKNYYLGKSVRIKKLVLSTQYKLTHKMYKIILKTDKNQKIIFLFFKNLKQHFILKKK